jgi:hypothetical protein
MGVDYRLAQDQAQRYYTAAFHLRSVTFPLVKDHKLLMGVLQNVFNSIDQAIGALLSYERELQLVPAYYDDFQSRFNTFRYRCMRRNNISADFAVAIQELKELLDLQKRTPMQFQRGTRLVLADKNYQLKVISVQDVDSFLLKNKQFLEVINHAIRLKH